MDAEESGPDISRRQALSTAGLAAVAFPLVARSRPAPALSSRADAVGAPGPEGAHVQFGRDAAAQVAVSWETAAAVSRPRLLLGQHSAGYGREIAAEGRVYTESLTGQTVWTYHPRLPHLQPHPNPLHPLLNARPPPVH